MAKKLISVCEKCGKQSCSGNLFIIKNTPLGDLTKCESELAFRNGKHQYHYVMGHGCDWYIEAERID